MRIMTAIGEAVSQPRATRRDKKPGRHRPSRRHQTSDTAGAPASHSGAETRSAKPAAQSWNYGLGLPQPASGPSLFQQGLKIVCRFDREAACWGNWGIGTYR